MRKILIIGLGVVVVVTGATSYVVLAHSPRTASPALQTDQNTTLPAASQTSLRCRDIFTEDNLEAVFGRGSNFTLTEKPDERQHNMGCIFVAQDSSARLLSFGVTYQNPFPNQSMEDFYEYRLRSSQAQELSGVGARATLSHGILDVLSSDKHYEITLSLSPDETLIKVARLIDTNLTQR